MPRQANRRNIVSRSRVPVLADALPVPDTAIELVERILSQVKDNYEDDIYDGNMLSRLGITAPTFPYQALSLPLTLSQSNPETSLLFINSVNTLAHMMLVLMKSVPIVAVNERKQGSDSQYLGLYRPAQANVPRHIELNTPLIFESSQDPDLQYIASSAKTDSYLLMCALVLIHELSHAVMDVENYGLTDNNSFLYKTYTRPSFAGEKNYSALHGEPQPINFYHIREESYANIITYKVTANAMLTQRKNGPLPYLKAFIRTQPPSYALASMLFDDNNILGWVLSKIDGNNPLSQMTANAWMDAAEDLFLKKIKLNDYRSIEDSLKVPWLKK